MAVKQNLKIKGAASLKIHSSQLMNGFWREQCFKFEDGEFKKSRNLLTHPHIYERKALVSILTKSGSLMFVMVDEIKVRHNFDKCNV